ncbi:hypothetical protein OG735_39380 [Streptomyces sp. NBC_01210]|uniref:hypothetical protein n=1 Tax=Streptomyces sp. NBC_01210 TaxID=2903774 RepID=UPI002E1539EB|nr:hypothetical protein OG735_39380 [Streptomyces sp. NBC_01210]
MRKLLPPRLRVCGKSAGPAHTGPAPAGTAGPAARPAAGPDGMAGAHPQAVADPQSGHVAASQRTIKAWGMEPVRPGR